MHYKEQLCRQDIRLAIRDFQRLNSRNRMIRSWLRMDSKTPPSERLQGRRVDL